MRNLARVMAVACTILMLAGCGGGASKAVPTQPAATEVPVPTATPTAAPSPEQQYAHDMKPVLDGLTNFADSSSKFKQSLQENMAMLSFCAASDQYITKPCDLGSASTLLGLADDVRNSGFETKSKLEAVTPLPALRTSHTEVARCIDFQMQRAKYFQDLVKVGTLGNIQADANSCDLFSNAVEMITKSVVQ